MRYGFVTLFPELYAFLDHGLLGRARAEGKLRFDFANPRDFARDKHRTVDDTPYGGGSGMVLMPGPYVDAIESLDPEHRSLRVLLTPQGRPFRQESARRFAAHGDLLLVSGRYEGFDERIRHFVDEEISLGDFVMLGGEAAAIDIVEATSRIVPGVIGNPDSLVEESHSRGVLEYPQYTRPLEYRGHHVPEILRSGNHAAIARFRRKEALRRTRARRPDLLVELPLDKLDHKLLSELDAEAESDERALRSDAPEDGGRGA